LNYSCTSLSSAVKSFMSFNLRAFFQTFQFPFFLSEVYRENLELMPAFDRGFFPTLQPLSFIVIEGSVCFVFSSAGRICLQKPVL
jgi:hypothetical protein